MKIIALFLIFLLTATCEKDFSHFYSYTTPEQANDGLEVGTLDQVNMDSQMLAKAIGRIKANKYGQVHSFLIYKEGLLVFEEYFEGNKFWYEAAHHRGERIQWHRDSMHVIMSCSKSITSAAIGIAIDKGFIQSVHQSIFDYLPNHQSYKKEGKENITIEHLLSMTSGLEWDEWSTGHGTAANDIDRIYWECSNDPVACVLENSLVKNLGDKFVYNGGGTIILGEILRNATGNDIRDFSNEHLFVPLGIDSVYWFQFANGVYATDGSIRLTPRDMLKFGITYLNNGVYNNLRIIAEDWVTKSSRNYGNNSGIRVPINDFGKMGYTYSWWTDEVNYAKKNVNLYCASGWGGQKIIVMDELDMVIVFTGGNYQVKSHYREIIERFILPSLF